MQNRTWIQDMFHINQLYLRLMRDVARADYGEAMSMFGIDSITAQRVARASLGDLGIIAATDRPLMTLIDNRGMRALFAQVEAKQPIERIELSRLSAVLTEAATNLDLARS